MPSDLNTLWTLVDQLDAEAECVTFFDALALVRAAKPFEDLPKGLVVDWVALHDAPHVTDGARAILGQYLQRLGARQQLHRRLAKQLIVLKDSGKTLRVSIAQSIALALDARPQEGFVWQCQSLPDWLYIEAEQVGHASGDARARARYLLRATQVGAAMCTFEEVRIAGDAPAGVMPTKTNKRAKQSVSQAPRTFCLFVIAEAEHEMRG